MPIHSSRRTGPRGVMQSIELIRRNLRRSEELVLMGVEEMREHALVCPTPNGGCHTLWVLGHLAYIETLVIEAFMQGRPNPLSEWQDVFDGADVSEAAEAYPPFDDVLSRCRSVRAATCALLDGLDEGDLDRPARAVPDSVRDLLGTYRQCFQYVADHWYMHRGHLADARRAAGLARSWL